MRRGYVITGMKPEDDASITINGATVRLTYNQTNKLLRFGGDDADRVRIHLVDDADAAKIAVNGKLQYEIKHIRDLLGSSQRECSVLRRRAKALEDALEISEAKNYVKHVYAMIADRFTAWLLGGHCDL